HAFATVCATAPWQNGSLYSAKAVKEKKHHSGALIVATMEHCTGSSTSARKHTNHFASSMRNASARHVTPASLAPLMCDAPARPCKTETMVLTAKVRITLCGFTPILHHRGNRFAECII